LKDRAFECHDPSLFYFPAINESRRRSFGTSPEPSFLLKEPKEGYWKDEGYKVKRHNALYGNYSIGRKIPIPSAFQDIQKKKKKKKKGDYPIRSLVPNAYFRRKEVKRGHIKCHTAR